MVNQGKPSTACGRCRERRLRCERQPEGCGNCERARTRCPGYRSVHETGFFDQTEYAQQKVNERVQNRLAKRSSQRNLEDGNESRGTGRFDSLQDALTSSSGGFSVGESVNDMTNVLQWFFERRDPREQFDVAQRIWVDPCWYLAQSSGAFFRSVMMLSLQDKLSDSNPSVLKQYFTEKSLLICEIQQEVDQYGDNIDSKTLLAGCALAYCEILDGNLEAAVTHIRVIQSTGAIGRLSKEEWLYIAWTDLRFALFTKNPPLLRFKIPSVVKSRPLRVLPDPIPYKLASQCASRCPQSSQLEFGLTSIFEIFVKLHELSLDLPRLTLKEDIPFAQLYELEYQLRVLYSSVYYRRKNDSDLFWTCVELVLLSVQLCVWRVSATLSPVRKSSRLQVVLNAYELLESVESLPEIWCKHARPESLSWVTLIIMTEFGSPRNVHPVALRVLLDSLTLTSISTYEQFIDSMKTWPCCNQQQSEIELGAIWTTIENHKRLDRHNFASQNHISLRDHARVLGEQSSPHDQFGVLEFRDIK